MRRVKLLMRHVFNPLHVYCRLCEVGLGQPAALRVCRMYERWIYRAFS